MKEFVYSHHTLEVILKKRSNNKIQGYTFLLFDASPYVGLEYFARTRQPPYSKSKAQEKTRRQTKYEAILDQVKTHTLLSPHDCAANKSLHKYKL